MAKLKSDAEKIFYAGIDAADAEKAVMHNLQIRNQELFVKGRLTLSLRRYERIFITGAGKAAPFMARAAAKIIGKRLTSGIIIGISRHDAVKLPGQINYYKGNHPLPDNASVRATGRLMRLLQTLREEDLVINLITGGGSALLCAPAKGISLNDKIKVTGQLLKSGASISEINAVRKHISAIKGGLFAKHSGKATLITLAISDVIGDFMDVIASGPTAPDPSTFSDCLKIINQYGLTKQVPASVALCLRQGANGFAPETPKANDSAIFTGKYNFVIGSNRTALEGAKSRAIQLGYKTRILSNSLFGTPANNADAIAKLIRTNTRNGCRTCLISGGEMIVRVTGRGKGGRNQQFCLEMAKRIDGMNNVIV
ncbi:MAG: glycerate kinase, partial [Planctomycetes bacterium]|nr:glycerate kinase [Planctomycetota bacterium]